MVAVLAPMLGDATIAGCAATRVSMDCAGGRESLGLQVSLFSFLFALKGHYLQVLHLRQSQNLNLILLAISMGCRLLLRGALGVIPLLLRLCLGPLNPLLLCRPIGPVV